MSMPAQHGLGPCIEATAGDRDQDGYVRIWVNGRRVFAHRLAWILLYGQIPPSLLVCHRCDNPPCVRYDHLFLGTIVDNNKDRVLKKRSATAKGEENNAAKLYEEVVYEIRKRRARGESAISIGKRFGINRNTVYDIEKKRSWSHLNDAATKT